jgi:hypothetical protein
MTKKEAKALTLKVWKYLRDHGQISLKTELPFKLYKDIWDLECECPLCEIFIKAECAGCPLQKAGEACVSWFTISLGREASRREKSAFIRWDEAKTSKTRSKYAGKIYDIVKAWKV